jgi:hypothetical protein
MARLPNPSYMSYGNTAGQVRGPQGGGSNPAFPLAGPLLFSGFATPSTIANTGAQTLFTQYTMPGGTITKLGALIRITAGFIFSTTGTPTLTIEAWLGGLLGLRILARGRTTENNSSNVAIAAQVPVAWDSGAATAANFRYLGGLLLWSDKALSDGFEQVQVTAQTGNVDLTAPLTIGFSAHWGAGDPSNTITQESMTVEALFPALAG